MIEIICNGDDEAKEKNEKNEKNTAIRRPKNIKQIGDVSSDRKIYIEDYAFTYIRSIAYGTPQEEQSGYSSENVRNPVKKNVCLLKGLLRQDIQGKTADRISILMKKCGMAFMQMLRNIFRICRLWAGLLRFRMLQQNGCSICAVYIWIILRET
ncbi:MAG: hypothetical protein ACLTH3_00365 [Lachnospira sp.]